MDTPQLAGPLLAGVLAGLADDDAVLGDAEDGGWWVLALRDPAAARALVGVPMSTDRTGRDTRAALESAGLRTGTAPVLRDVDEVADAEAVALAAPGSRFGRSWAEAADEGTPDRAAAEAGRGRAPSHGFATRPDRAGSAG